MASWVTLSTWVSSPSAVVRDKRRLQCEFGAGLDLAQHAGHLETAVCGPDLDRVETQVGGAGEFHPLFEERA